MSLSNTNTEMVAVIIDGHSVQVEKGINVIDAAAKAKKEIPHYCYHPKLSVSGNCRMCLVEIGLPMRDKATGEAILEENGAPKIAWGPKPVIGCATKVAEGMHIRTQSSAVKSAQEGVMEFLLVNHPLDCPICDQAGECRLQEFAIDYGRGYSRFVEDKNVKPKRTPLGPRVMLDDERCILCSRCIRFMEEVPKEHVLGFTQRGSYSTLTCFPGSTLDSNYSLNTVDICPVGALTSTDFRFKMRTWFLKRTPSICTESSVGVNTEVWSREGTIYRITPRQNDFVNDTWMADSGRMLYKQVEAPNRLKAPLLGGKEVSLQEALKQAATLLRSGPCALLSSGGNTLEEQYLLTLLKEVLGAPSFVASHKIEGDGLLISNDGRPNMRGALLTGLVEDFSLRQLQEAIQEGHIQTVFVYNEDISLLNLAPDTLDKLSIIYLGTHTQSCLKEPSIQIPTLTVFEKSGTFINQQFRLQKFHQAVPGTNGTLPDFLILSNLLSLLVSDFEKPQALSDIWNALSDKQECFSGINFESIPENGLLLDIDNSIYASALSFDDKSSLKYNPNYKDAI